MRLDGGAEVLTKEAGHVDRLERVNEVVGSEAKRVVKDLTLAAVTEKKRRILNKLRDSARNPKK